MFTGRTSRRRSASSHGRIESRSPACARFAMQILYHDARRNLGRAGTGATHVDRSTTSSRERFCLAARTTLASTRHLMNAERHQDEAARDPHQYLTRSCRDEKALAEALKEGVIAGAGLDVYEREPAVEPALLELENAVLLPHIASASMRTRTRMAVRAAENISAFIDGKPLLDPVP